MRALLALVLLIPLAAHGQDATTEDKLRDALRRATVDLRGLQDTQAQLQADRDSAAKQRDTLQAQVADLTAKLAAATPASAVPGQPVDTEAAAKAQEELKRLSDALDQAMRDNAALAASNAKWQSAYREAAGIAQTRDADAKRSGAGLKAARKVNDADHDANKKLAALATDILHLYRTQSFKRLLLGSYEPLLGFKQVELENTVQDWEDKIDAQRVFPAPGP